MLFTEDVTKKYAKLFLYFIVAVIVITMALFVKTKIFNNDTLLKNNAKQEVVIDSLNINNSHLKDFIVKKEAANKITEIAVTDNIEKKAEQSSTNVKRHEATEVKVVKIKKNFSEKIDKSVDAEETLKLIREQEIEVSKTRISALWVNYCSHEPNQPSCKDFSA